MSTNFGFPFIIAVKGKTKDEILAAFETRIGNDRATEFDTACRQVERIALLRLQDILPLRGTPNDRPHLLRAARRPPAADASC